MRVNWMSNSYPQGEGYGRFSAHMIATLLKQGVDVMPCLRDHVTMPDWMLKITCVSWDDLTIACMPPWYLPDYEFPGRLWLFSMTEGGALPYGWADFIHNAGVERVIVPCEHNRLVFQSELDVPVHIVPGGTDPDQFPLDEREPNGHYTFLALADRGNRKGYTDVWQAFYTEFGGPTDTPDVELIVKYRPSPDHVMNRLKEVVTDPRIRIWDEELPHPAEVWREADCVVIPSRSEGWGMPHREAAMMGKPVIATRWSGLDDGKMDNWAIPLDDLRIVPINAPPDEPLNGVWAMISPEELRSKMRWCYEHQNDARHLGRAASHWLRENQTWDHSAKKMMELLNGYFDSNATG